MVIYETILPFSERALNLSEECFVDVIQRDSHSPATWERHGLGADSPERLIHLGACPP